MKVPVELTARQARALEKAASFVAYTSLFHDLGEDFDANALRRALGPLRRAQEEASCQHCGLRDSSRKNGLCDRCNVYQRSFNRLPSKRTLARTLRKAS